MRSDIRYLDLPFLTPATSSYRDNAHTATSAIDFMLPRLKDGKLTAGGSLFISRGSRPTRYYQPLAPAVAAAAQTRILEHRMAVLWLRRAVLSV